MSKAGGVAPADWRELARQAIRVDDRAGELAAADAPAADVAAGFRAAAARYDVAAAACPYHGTAGELRYNGRACRELADRADPAPAGGTNEGQDGPGLPG